MAERDFFAEIALAQHPLNHDDTEIPPREHPSNIFTKSNKAFPYDKISTFQDTSYEEKFTIFQQDLKALKDQYCPYLQNHMPPVETVKKTELKTFQYRHQNSTHWEEVTIPHYTGPTGKWKANYKTTFTTNNIPPGHHAILHFQSVDYKTIIYVNGSFIGQHEGFFAPFDFDITDYLQPTNELIIEIQNDIPTKGDEGPLLDGDKIYAATGPGWDDPIEGWHHCPPGAGIIGKVTIEYRPTIHIDDIFVRPNIDNNWVELRLGVTNYKDDLPTGLNLDVLICPKNFIDNTKVDYKAEIAVIGRGKNEYRYLINLPSYRLWEPSTPYLYGIICTISKDSKTLSQSSNHFGMRKFISDETTTPKGKFYLNNKPIILRGANEMGHLQQCVMTDNFDQLVEDILIAKLCNMNYYRLTQRPVQKEIYDYMDALGMMNQSDLPLFSTLRRNQVAEAVKQTGEMEHLLRGHPSAILTTFINEPVCIRPTDDPNHKFSKRYRMKGHRHLLRDELEAFFVAARKITYIANPDRVIKNVEGDYDPPTAQGMPDFHTYTMWYTNHPIPIGKLIRGYIPPVKKGWMIGCGEYGAEGLDNESIMQTRYPKDWIQEDENGRWYPNKIIKAQTHSMHGDWYPEQSTIKSWIESSQTHQATATKLMTDALRRRADCISHTAIHLLIDAWPSGWMKTLVGCDRIPKKAYYTYKEALIPYKLNLRCDRKYVYAGEEIPVEAWLLNDTSENKKGEIIASLTLECGKILSSYSILGNVDATYSICAGIIPIKMPQIEEEITIYLDAAVLDETGAPIHAERITFHVYPRLKPGSVTMHGHLSSVISTKLSLTTSQNPETLVVSDLTDNTSFISTWLDKGKNAVILLQNQETDITIANINIKTKKGPEIFCATAIPRLEKYQLNMLYNEESDHIDFLSTHHIESKGGETLLYTYEKFTSTAPKPRLPLAKKYQIGNAALIILCLNLAGKVGANANLDHFLIDCIEGRI
ncbi:MAG: hypothetical protein FWE11_10415 [Defluviitaleaceae bacterium]|nr:hypothetical protein [Defluviitaleaceae bacterium]